MMGLICSRQHQAGQMQHRADADARAEIRRAGGQVAEFGAESVIQFLLQRGIHLVNGAPGLPQLQAGTQRLHPQMILLVDHHAERFLAVQDQAAAGAFRGVFAADEMALDQNLLVQRGQIVHRLGKRVLHLRQAFDGGPDQSPGRGCARAFLPSRERPRPSDCAPAGRGWT